ncbi:MAG: hypothetical protein KGZ86_08710 [Candidatus Latescibacteria bacterium]|nr:hypothetical protein [Candidatus Latescibacterota bacterium]
MQNALRVEIFSWLPVEQDKLSPRIGCGLVLVNIPKFHGSDAFRQILAGYRIKNIFADKTAQKLLKTEKIVQQFCTNALASISLNENFRTVFKNYRMIFLIDQQKESAWLIGDVENRLPFLSYYREVVPNILKEMGITLTGSFTRLLPIGWQNFYDVIDKDIFKTHPEVTVIEILSIITDARWRNQVLGIGINLLNLTTPATIQQRIIEVLPGVKI